MEETSTTIPPKGLGSIKWNDLLKGLYYAVFGSIVLYFGFIFNSILQEHPRLPNWVESLPYIKGIAASFGGYLLGKLGVNNVGQIFTKDKAVVRVDATELKDLQQKADDNKSSNNTNS
jgi:hypothetical protein